MTLSKADVARLTDRAIKATAQCGINNKWRHIWISFDKPFVVVLALTFHSPAGRVTTLMSGNFTPCVNDLQRVMTGVSDSVSEHV